MTTSDTLTQKELLFCRLYPECLHTEHAAAEAGISLKRARELLVQPETAALIDRYAAERRRLALQTGLARGIGELDFSPEADLSALVRLSQAYRGGEAPVKPLPLANVSELKLLRDGGIEIKFFDRGRLLEALCGFAGEESPAGQDSGLVRAVEESARALRQK